MLRNGVIAALIFAVLAVWAGSARAEYEPTLDSATNINVGLEPVALPEGGVQIVLTDPGVGDGSVFHGFMYMWTDSAAELDDEVFNKETADNVGNAVTEVQGFLIEKEASFFEQDDASDLRYLHVKTWYLAEGQEQYSSDVVFTVNIDAVAPTGTVEIVDADLDPITETTSTSLLLEVLAQDVDLVHIGESESLQAATEADYDATGIAYELADTTPGEKVLYVWLEDSVGNISSVPATATVTLVDPSAAVIQPSKVELDIADIETCQFLISGGGEGLTYSWEVVDEDGNLSTVAEVLEVNEDTTRVTVQLLSEGTFKMKAVSAEGEFFSGVNIITQSVLLGDVNGDGRIRSLDAILVLRHAASLITLDAAAQKAADVTKDGRVRSLDAIKILRYAARLIDEF